MRKLVGLSKRNIWITSFGTAAIFLIVMAVLGVLQSTKVQQAGSRSRRRYASGYPLPYSDAIEGLLIAVAVFAIIGIVFLVWSELEKKDKL